MSWQKKVLRVNLTEGSSSVEPLNMEWANDYLGERGLATKYLMESMDPKTDAMSPENVLIFATGPLTGTMSSTSGRYAVVTKGPLTNAIACSNSGGKFGAELKYAGYDLLILEGRSPAPVYLHIVNDSVEILPADELWGTTVWHTEEWLKARHQNPLLKVASIGVAGESGVRYACIMNDLHRAAGRSGVGAVMGVKNLKAIAVHGSVGVSVNDPKRFMEAVRETHELLANNRGRKGLTKYGTNSMIDTMQEFGSLPTRNFHAVQFDGVEKIDARAMMTPKPDGHVNLLTNKACFGCTIACGRIAHIDKTHFTIVNRQDPFHHRQSKRVLARLRRPRVRDRLRLRAAGRRRRHRRAHLCRLPHERARHGSDLLRRNTRVGHGALRDGPHHHQGHRWCRAHVGQCRGAHGDGGEDRQVRRLRPGPRSRLAPHVREVRASGALHGGQGPGVRGLRLPGPAGHGPRLPWASASRRPIAAPVI
jgi:hypothetical protein